MIRRTLRIAIAAAAATTTCALLASTPAFASPTAIASAEEQVVSSDGGQPDQGGTTHAIAAAAHVHARLSRFDEAEVTWRLAATGSAPAAFVVEIVPSDGSSITSVTVEASTRAATIPHLASATRFAVRVLVIDAEGAATLPVVAEDLFTETRVAAVLRTDHEALSASATAERAEWHADRLEEQVGRTHGRARIDAKAAAARARHQAHTLERAAAAARHEADRARNRLEHAMRMHA